MDDDDLGFTFQATGSGDVRILRAGKAVTMVRGDRAKGLLEDLASADSAGQQQILARITGNYRRGNERQASAHPRNR